MTTTPPIEPLVNHNGVTYPFPGGQQVTVTSGYGDRIHPISGRNTFHAGVDLVVTGDPRILAFQGGRVTHVLSTAESGGFGNTVIIEMPDGHRAQYAHLDEMHVAPGEVIVPGQTIGVMGNTGQSTGPHLDLTIYRPGVPVLDGNYQDSTIDPMVYLTTVTNLEQTPMGAEAIADYDESFSGVPSGIERHDQYSAQYGGDGGRVRTGSTYSTPDSVYNNAMPQRTPRADRNRSSYRLPNNPDHNYGYRVLNEDSEYRRALSDTANNLGIPAQWLADVIALESGPNHLPSITNGSRCVGMIQFCWNGGLADIAEEMGISQAQASSRLATMSRAEQMHWVGYYIGKYSNGGEDLRTIEDLYGLVNGGPRTLSMNPRDRDRLSDGNGMMVDHFQKLGNGVGRRYALSSDRYLEGEGDVHNVAVPNCPECMRMMNAFGTIHPHHEPR